MTYLKTNPGISNNAGDYTAIVSCRHWKRSVAAATIGIFSLSLSSIALAETAEEKGMTIAVEADNRNNGFVDTTSSMTMILKNRNGKESKRSMRSLTLEVPGDGDKSMTIFDEPKDVKGTASLTYSHATKPDEQWLYLPALKRVKRISSKNKSGPFMGSDFAFEDISSQEVDKYTYKFLRDETLDGTPVFVVESYPAYKNSGYTRLINWIHAEEYYPLKTEFYDRKNVLLKTLRQRGHVQYLGKFWRPQEMYMENAQVGKSTTLTWENYQFKTGLSASDFSSKALKKFR